MARRAFNIGTLVSAVFLGVTFALWLATLWINPRDHHLSLSDGFHIGVSRNGWDSRLAFFSDGEWGPYRGSIIGIADNHGKIQPPREREIYFGDILGIYYRYFRWTDLTLWTLTLSLWYPTILFAVLPLLWWIQRSRSRTSRVVPDRERSGEL